MNTTRKYWLGAAALLLAALISTNAAAAPVVVGSVNPATNHVTIFQDLLVPSFPDGTPIQHLYGRFDAGAHEFLLVRAGKTAAGGCRTDAFRLLRLSGNRLALALDSLTPIPWDGAGVIRPLKLCFSGTCQGWCQVLGNPDTPLDPTDYLCQCADGPGACEPGLLNGYKPEDIVWQGPTL
jgi:hypothetical protein